MMRAVTTMRVCLIAILISAGSLLPGATAPDVSKRLLAAHNIARAAAGAPMLAWSPYLTREARFWADHLARTETFEHAPERPTQEPQGENLWIGTRGAATPEAMVGAWVAERKHFRAGRFPDVSTTGGWSAVGHYTQLIWTKTTYVGCAVASNPVSDILVCRYSPAGNVMGESPLAAPAKKPLPPVLKKRRRGG
jgi:uncharacterized protein YkwD